MVHYHVNAMQKVPQTQYAIHSEDSAIADLTSLEELVAVVHPVTMDFHTVDHAHVVVACVMKLPENASARLRRLNLLVKSVNNIRSVTTLYWAVKDAIVQPQE